MHFDSHIHSHASPDSDMPPEEAIATCAALGLGVTFTEHVDYKTPDYGFDPAAPDQPVDSHEFVPDPALYPAGYERLRGDACLLGLEIGMTAYFLPKNRQTAQAYDYDFIIGSVHYVDGYDLYNDSRNTFTFDYDRKHRMLTYTLEMIERYDFIDALGHIDFLSRYSPAPDKLVRYDDYAGEYDALLSAMARRGVALEINTARFGKLPGLEENLLRVYKRFYALGGRHVTIGSDAHKTPALGRYHPQALTMAKAAGLTPVYFKKRRLCPCE